MAAERAPSTSLATSPAAAAHGADLHPAHLVVDLAADLLRNPSFPEDRVRLTIDRRLGLLKSRADQPRVVASELFDEITRLAIEKPMPVHSLNVPTSAAQTTSTSSNAANMPSTPCKATAAK